MSLYCILPSNKKHRFTSLYLKTFIKCGTLSVQFFVLYTHTQRLWFLQHLVFRVFLFSFLSSTKYTCFSSASSFTEPKKNRLKTINTPCFRVLYWRHFRVVVSRVSRSFPASFSNSADAVLSRRFSFWGTLLCAILFWTTLKFGLNTDRAFVNFGGVSLSVCGRQCHSPSGGTNFPGRLRQY